jgi:hypothetical protein
VTTVYAQPQAAGQDDFTYIRRFREMLRDQPRFSNENFTGDGTTVVMVAQRAPINDDEFFSVTVGGVATQATQSWPPLSTQVYVDFDTGTLVFGTAPPAGTPKNVTVIKRVVRWRDSAIQAAMLEGLHQLFPALWTTTVDTTLTVQQDTYDYTLPAQFNDPGVRILSLAVQDIPSTIEPFRKNIAFDRIGLTTLHIYNPNRYMQGAVLRIEYAGPYQSLGDLQPQAKELPILYAAGSLLGFGEARRSVIDTQTVQGPEQALPPGQMQAAGAGFMQQFQQAKADLARPMKMAGWRSTYRR